MFFSRVKLKNFLSSGHSFSEQEANIAFQYRVVNYFMLVAVIFGCLIGVLGFLQVMKIGKLQASADVLYSTINLALIWQLRKDRKHFSFVVWLQVSATWFLFLVALLSVHNDEFRIVWFYISIYIAFMMLGVRAGILFAILSILAIVLVGEFGELYISHTAVMTALFGMVVFALLSRAYSLQMSGYERMLENHNRALEMSVAEMNEALATAQEADQIKNLFLANMSHEIRTPMNGMLTLAQVMKTTPLNEQQQGYLTSIERSGHTLLRLLDDLLDLSVIESGRLEISNRQFKTWECIEDLLTQLEPLFDHSDVQFSVDVSDDIPAYLVGDEVRLKQVISNLVSNAAKYTRKGEVKVYIGGRYQSNNRYNLHVEVIDTGIGIPGSQLQAIFEPFQQLSADRIASKGVGLGLPICKKIVEAMQGDIHVVSIERQGSTFIINITLGVGQQDTGVVENTGQLEVTKPLSVLLVEDDSISRYAVQTWLTGEGHQVHIAENGAMAVDLLKQGAPVDVVLMDVHMPVMNGVDATRTIKQQSLTTAPIIGMTASVMNDERKSYLAAGMDALVEKPVNFTRLMKVVKSRLPA